MNETGMGPLGLSVHSSVALLVVGFLACSDRPTSDPTTPPEVPEGHGYSTIHDVGLEAPQSILYDSVSDLYLVSNIAGDTSSATTTGFISRLKPSGEVESLRWIDGERSGVSLRSPRGMAIHGDTLFVADLDCIRLFDRAAGTPLHSLCLGGPGFLNDVAVDRRGMVYATSDGMPRQGQEGGRPGVYSVRPGSTLEEVFLGEDLGHPQGIAAGPRGVFFCGSDNGQVSQVRPDGPRRVFRGKEWYLTGIVFTPDGSFALSNPKNSSVIFVHAKDGGSKGEVFTLVRNVPTPGDLGYDLRRERILIPRTGSNSLLFVDLWP